MKRAILALAFLIAGSSIAGAQSTTTLKPLLAAQDFKRARDGDQGPNTGGMGAYVPLPWAPDGLAEEVMATVVQPAIDELTRRGTPYRGLLYAGLALTAKGVKVVEFNARFGDPETQVVLDRLATTGRPSRAEITDAAMSGRAECVMLNKGPQIREAVRVLDDILRRMHQHQSKKRSLLRRLGASDYTHTPPPVANP